MRKGIIFSLTNNILLSIIHRQHGHLVKVVLDPGASFISATLKLQFSYPGSCGKHSETNDHCGLILGWKL